MDSRSPETPSTKARANWLIPLRGTVWLWAEYPHRKTHGWKSRTLKPPRKRTHASPHLAVVQLTELLDDPLLQDQSLPQLLPVVFHRHLPLLPLHRVVPGDGDRRADASDAGRGLKKHPAARGGQRSTRLGADGGHGCFFGGETALAAEVCECEWVGLTECVVVVHTTKRRMEECRSF